MSEWWNNLDMLVKILYCVAIPATLILVIQTIMSMLGGMDSGAGIDASDTSGLSDLGGSMSGGADVSGFDASGLDSSGFDMSGLNTGGFDAAAVDVSFDGAPDVGELADASDMGLHDVQHFTDGGNPSDLSALRLFTLQGLVAFLTVFGWSSIASISSGAAPTLSVLLGIVFGLIAMFAIAKLVQVSRRLTENGNLDLRNAIGETGSVYIPIPSKGTGEGKVTMNLQGRYMECPAVTEGDNTLPTGIAVRIVDLRNGSLVVEEDN